MGKDRKAVAELLGTARVPLREVSGLAVRTAADGALHLLAIGDRTAEVAVAPVAADATLGEWIVVDLHALDRDVAGLAQLEAVAADGAGLVAVLAEEPALLVAGDAATRRLAGAWRLDVSAAPEAAWDADENSRGEGLVLMRNGHALVAKEKRPPYLIEFGPAGSTALGLGPDSFLAGGEAWPPPAGDSLVALAAWPVDDARLADLSDLALDARRRPWVLSDQSRSLGRIETGADGAVSVVDLVQLPKGVEKPEGLAFLPDGSALVASDLPGEADNLVRVRLPLP